LSDLLDISLYQTNEIKNKAMKTYEQIIETITSEINNKQIINVSQCRNRIETLCNENNQQGNMFSISNVFGVA